jgi:lipoate---protein ligase
VPPGQLTDVEQFRGLRTRQLQTRTVDRPTLVLGSTQPVGLVNHLAAAELGVEVLRRRGGGGAVYLGPTDPLWIDAWVPRSDPLWEHDVTAAPAWAGSWWSAALRAVGLGHCHVHEGRSIPGTHGNLVCFAGRGPGEVFAGDRKVVGLSQWRSRQGTLFMMCAYRRWQPGPMLELLTLPAAAHVLLSRVLPDVAVGVEELVPSPFSLHALSQELQASFLAWGRGADPLPD